VVRGADPDLPPQPNAAPAAIYGLGVEPAIIRFAPFVWSNRAELVDDEEHPTRFTLDSPAAMSALEQFFPWLSPCAAFRRHEGRIQAVDGTMLDADKQSYTVGGALTAQMDLGDAIYKTLAAKQLIKASDHALEAQRPETVLNAAWGYFDLAKAQALAAVVKEALDISQEYQRQIHEAVAAGIAFKGDELRVQTQTERYQINLRQSLEQQRIAAAALAQVLHLDPSVELTPRDTDMMPLRLVESNAPLDSLMQQALRSRPELKQSQALVQAAREAKNGAVYGPLIPTLGAQVLAGGLGGGKGDSLGNFGDSEDYFVGLGWRIGPGGLLDFGRVNASKARLETLKLSGAKLIDEITRQVVQNHARVLSLSDQIATAQQNLTTTAETLRLTRGRKQFGVGVVLEDIQAQQELTRARSDYLSVIAEYNKAQYALDKATGHRPALDRNGAP
jgi:outer membrane protein TolC